MDDRWLDTANPNDLEVLANNLADRRLVPPYSAASAQHVGVDGAHGFLASLGDTEPRVVAWMLRRMAEERRRAADQYAAVAQLAWSGAAEGEHPIRDTRVVLDELFGRAERYVLISTFVIYDGRSIFADLARRLRDRPQLAVEMYVNLPQGARGDEDEASRVREFLKRFRHDLWPGDLPLPALYYDAESKTDDGKKITLHAKAVVVDDRWAFVTSANFTEAAQERNIEAGVLLDHPGIATSLAGRFRSLRELGRLRRMV